MAFDGMNMTNFQLKIGFNFEKYFKLNFLIGLIVSTQGYSVRFQRQILHQEYLITLDDLTLKTFFSSTSH